jgi:hypothetical protein
VFKVLRVAPEEAEHLREGGAVFGAADEAGLEGVVEIVAPGEAGSLNRADGVQYATGPMGRPALRNARAKWVMLWASLPFSGMSRGVWVAIVGARGFTPLALPVGYLGTEEGQRGKGPRRAAWRFTSL